MAAPGIIYRHWEVRRSSWWLIHPWPARKPFSLLPCNAPRHPPFPDQRWRWFLLAVTPSDSQASYLVLTAVYFSLLSSAFVLWDHRGPGIVFIPSLVCCGSHCRSQGAWLFKYWAEFRLCNLGWTGIASVASACVWRISFPGSLRSRRWVHFFDFQYVCVLVSCPLLTLLMVYVSVWSPSFPSFLLHVL